MSNQILSISSDKYAYEAIDKMHKNKVGSLLAKEGNEYVGIITKMDWMFLFLNGESDPNEVKVFSLMTKIKNTIDVCQSVAEAGAIVEKKRVRHIPVTRSGRVVGMFSVKDLEKYYLQLQKLT